MPDQQKRETPTKSRRPITSTNTSKPARKFVQQNKCPDTKPHHHHTGSNKAQHQTKLALTIGTLLSSQRTDAHCCWSSRPPAGQPDLHYPRIWASTNRLDLRVPVLVTKRKLRPLRFAEGDRRVVGPAAVQCCRMRSPAALCGSHQGLGKATYRRAPRQIRWSEPFSERSAAPARRQRSAGEAVLSAFLDGWRRTRSDVGRPRGGEHYHLRHRRGFVARTAGANFTMLTPWERCPCCSSGSARPA